MSISGLPKMLTIEEKKYLLSVERGDLANVKRMMQRAHKHNTFNINCVDSLGRSALTLAIDGENLEMVELLVIMGVETRDSLLHAINVEFVEAVELLLEHEEIVRKKTESYSWQNVDLTTSSFTADMTPLILAAHRNNYEILKILLDRGATLPMPHDIKCGCDECIRERREDSLRHSLSRVNIYKALASPSLISLSSTDPILTAFQLSFELKNLAFAEPECKNEYLDLRKQCQKFAVDLLHQSRNSHELAIVLNHNSDTSVEKNHIKLCRLNLAIQYKQKQFVAHPNIQQLLAAIWYEGVPGFRRKSTLQKILIIIKVALMFPFYCCVYIVAPNSNRGRLVRKPFMKFLIHASSYIMFIIVQILVSQRVEEHLDDFFNESNDRKKPQRGNSPTILEFVILLYVIGFIQQETLEICSQGIRTYLRNLWSFIDFTRNFLYSAVFILRLAAYLQQHNEISVDPARAFISRENWDAFDPQLIAEGLFAAANIFSALKLVHLFSINPHLGPLQISLGRMVIDIAKFFFIYALVLFAFACGLNQLLWYFSNLERDRCFGNRNDTEVMNDNEIMNNAEIMDTCSTGRWRGFANVFEASQSLFWASFGLLDLNHFELAGIKAYTRFWSLLMFGSYSVINLIVLLNLLIAMMSNSYTCIDEHSDVEWKFARTKLWLYYFQHCVTLPPPFNIFPTPKTIKKWFCMRKAEDPLRKMSSQSNIINTIDSQMQYNQVMRALVWRYITSTHRKQEENAVTEDDINEVKGDISAFRYEILNVLQHNGMDTSCADKKGKSNAVESVSIPFALFCRKCLAILGKKMKMWERRLMKDFKVAPVKAAEWVDSTSDEVVIDETIINEQSLAKFKRVANLTIMNPNIRRWKQVVKDACSASHIGKSSTKDSLRKVHNLEKAMTTAREFLDGDDICVDLTCRDIQLPDVTGERFVNVVSYKSEYLSNVTAKPESVTTKPVSSLEVPITVDESDTPKSDRKVYATSSTQSISFGWL